MQHNFSRSIWNIKVFFLFESYFFQNKRSQNIYIPNDI